MSDILERKIYQSNPLIESRKHMSLTEQRLFAIALQGVHPKLSENAGIYDLEFRDMIVPASELMDLLKCNGGSIDNLKKSLSDAFRSAHIEIRYGRGGIFLRHIFRRLDYEPNKGLRVQLDSELKPFILDLVNKAYTGYALKYVFPLSSAYALRIMELMLQYKGLSKRNPLHDDGSRVATRYFSIEDLRFKLDVPKGKYVGRMDNFRQRILDDPIAEINEKTIFHIDYLPKKEGRSIVGFTLEMLIPAEALAKPKDTVDSAASEKQLPAAKKSKKAMTTESSGMSEADFATALRKTMQQEKLSSNRVEHWISVYGTDYASELFQLVVKRADKAGLKGSSRTRYIASGMNHDWLASNQSQKKAENDERYRALLAKAERLNEKYLYDMDMYHHGAKLDPDKPPVPFKTSLYINMISQSIEEGSLSLTCENFLFAQNMTVLDFVRIYMSRDSKK